MKLLKDPLLHFLVLGALLFGAAQVRGGGEAATPDAGRIVIDAATVERVAAAARRLESREPTRDELLELLEPAIRDEMLYREALALGLDENDDEVRRRLIEKMQYLTRDLADPEPPSDAALREHFEREPARFARPAVVSFEQVYFSPQTRGDSLEADVGEAQRALRDGADPREIGDRTPLRHRYDDTERERADVLFGEEMTAALFAIEPGEWSGPFASDFGLHLARVVERHPARQRTFDEARDDVLDAYTAEKRAERNEAELERISARYDIVVEWPDGGDSRGGENGAGR